MCLLTSLINKRGCKLTGNFWDHQKFSDPQKNGKGNKANQFATIFPAKKKRWGGGTDFSEKEFFKEIPHENQRLPVCFAEVSSLEGLERSL